MQSITLKLKQLRKELYGHYGLISEECGFSRVTVGNVLNGVYMNQQVLDAAIKVRDRLREEKQNQLKQLADKI
jgi:hypothetical protein